MNTRSGFTVIEILIVITLFAVASIFFFLQKNDVEIVARDNERKIAINAIHYSLEEVYFKEHGSYPRTVSKDILPSVDEALFSDPLGVAINEATSNYRYEPTNCDGDACKSYTLRATLEGEDDFIKTNN